MERHRAHVGRMWVATAFILSLFGGLFGRLCWIQGKDAGWYRAEADKQHYATVPLLVRRGSIYDAVGRELAVSTEVPSIYANAREIADKAAVAERLGDLLDIDGEALAAQIRADLAPEIEAVRQAAGARGHTHRQHHRGYHRCQERRRRPEHVKQPVEDEDRVQCQRPPPASGNHASAPAAFTPPR